MALDPNDRYASMADFGHDLFRILRTISDLSPLDVIFRYLQNPSSITVKRQVPARKMSLNWTAISGVFALLALILLILLLLK